jgi:hypothetical protein
LTIKAIAYEYVVKTSSSSTRTAHFGARIDIGILFPVFMVHGPGKGKVEMISEPIHKIEPLVVVGNDWNAL